MGNLPNQPTGSGLAATFPESPCNSLFWGLEEVEVQGGRGQFSQSKKARNKPKISGLEKKGYCGSQAIYEKEKER